MSMMERMGQPMEATRVLLMSRDPMLAIALGTLLEGQSQYLIFLRTDESETTEEDHATIDIVLADIGSSECLARALTYRNRFPACKLLLWCHSNYFELALNAMNTGCAAIISRYAPPEQVVQALYQARYGTVSSKPTQEAFSDSVRLTDRESQLVTLLSRGLKNKEISACLGISEGSVKVYLSRLFEKTGAKDRFELALFGLKNLLYGHAERSEPVPVRVSARRALATSNLSSLKLVQSHHFTFGSSGSHSVRTSR